ncbi:MAG TPA: hypothetical protein VMN56_12265, partial [Casimicrobiaceae bacterium]|nr:hypothetical protein [Casimicrobiaceae bacterium]
MQITEDTLMRYADGELEPADRAEVEAAIRADAALGRRVEAFRAQRARLAKAFAPVLNEPVPDRLRQILEPPSAQVTDLAVRRESKRLAERVRAWSWPEVGAIAAALVLGVVIAQQVGREDGEAFHTGPNGVVASRAVSRALSEQLASTQPADAAVRVGLTFENQAGDFCRTFVQRAGDLNGIACRRDDEWRV